MFGSFGDGKKALYSGLWVWNDFADFVNWWLKSDVNHTRRWAELFRFVDSSSANGGKEKSEMSMVDWFWLISWTIDLNKLLLCNKQKFLTFQRLIEFIHNFSLDIAINWAAQLLCDDVTITPTCRVHVSDIYSEKSLIVTLRWVSKLLEAFPFLNKLFNYFNFVL